MLKHMWIAAALAGLAACGDNDGPSNTPDGPPTGDAPPGDSAQPFVPPTPFAIPISAMGPDQLQSVVATGDGKFYAAGFAAATPTGDRKVIVVKFTATGVDTTFGTQGVVTTAATFTPGGGGADEIDIGLQSDGKIIVSYTTATALGNDRDIAVLRLDTEGAPDLTFGDNGVRVHSLNTAIIPSTPSNFDVSRALAIDSADRIYVHAAQRAEDPANLLRTDLDFAVVRFTAGGNVDLPWGEQGEHVLVLPGGGGAATFNAGPATVRGIRALPDGTVIASGYQSLGGTPQPVLYKLTAEGDRDLVWAGGLFHEPVLAAQTEVYNFAIHGDKIVTAGYGTNTSGTTNDYISLRFNLADGVRDPAWGGTTNGAVVFDPSGTSLGSNCRNAVALKGGGTAMIGSTGPGNMPAQDAVFAILDANGRLDTRFGDGIHVYPLGANGNDQFWGGAASDEVALFVGYKGGGTTQSDTVNDDAYAVILPLP